MMMIAMIIDYIYIDNDDTKLDKYDYDDNDDDYDDDDDDDTKLFHCCC